MKKLIIGTFALLATASVWATPTISSLQGTTDTPQWRSLGQNNEWFSRYSSELDAATLSAFKTAPGNENGVNLTATSSKVTVTYLGTGAARDSNLFLAFAGAGEFNTADFWNPIYASGGTNNLGNYNPVNASNTLFETRAGCSYAQAKAGNTCLASQIGKTREITDVTIGSNLVFGLQALTLKYDADRINIPNTNYFFTGTNSNNSDARGWADNSFHAKVLRVGADEFLVGFEDQWLGRGSNSDRDYNDMVFLFKGVSAPIPVVPEADETLMMLSGLGLMAGAVARRRRRA